MAPATRRSACTLRVLGDIVLLDGAGGTLSRRRKELTLLAALILHPARIRSRHELVDLLWETSDPTHARQSLRQALLSLRRVLGDAIHCGPDFIAVEPEVIEADVHRFMEAVAAGRMADAVELWSGELLPGAEDLAGASLRAWLEFERQSLRGRLCSAYSALMEGAISTARWRDARRWVDRWQLAVPLDERPHIERVRILKLAGLMEEATAAHAELLRWWTEERGEEIPTELEARGEELRREALLWRGAPGVTTDDEESPGEALEVEWKRAASGTPSTVVVLGATPGGKTRFCDGFLRYGETERPRLVLRAGCDAPDKPLALFRALLAQLSETPGLGGVAPQELASLAFVSPAIARRYPAVRPIASSGAYQDRALASALEAVAAEMPTVLFLDDFDRADAGSRLVITGALSRLGSAPLLVLCTVSDGAEARATIDALRKGPPPRLLRIGGATTGLRLRMQHIARTLGIGAITMMLLLWGGGTHGSAGARLADAGDAGWQTARGGGRLAPMAAPVARRGESSSLPHLEVSTESPAALALYVEGVRAYYQGEDHTAIRVLEAALDEDTAFAMAAYYLALAKESAGQSGLNLLLGRAARLADAASDRERLLIRGAWANAMEHPWGFALAETLAIRYPEELAGHYFLGRARILRGDFLAALPHLRRVVHADTLGMRGHTPRCLGCDALAAIVVATEYADSLQAGERAAREWLRSQPHSARAWNALAATLEYQDRYDEALAARRRAAALHPGDRRVPLRPALIALRRGELEEACEALQGLARVAAPEVRREALWFLAIGLRYQGRLDEALTVARQLRAETEAAEPREPLPSIEAALEAQVLYEQGEFALSAALFDSVAMRFAVDRASSPDRRNRRAWMLTHAAGAWAAAGDTARLADLTGTLRRLGEQSGFARDRRLHHHARGLLLLARGDRRGAEWELQRSIFSRAVGAYTRTNHALASLMLEDGRAEEAIALLAAALRGPFDAAGLYVSRTETHELLARAYEAAGKADSAASHWAWVATAWRSADGELRARAERAELRVAELRTAPMSTALGARQQGSRLVGRSPR